MLLFVSVLTFFFVNLSPGGPSSIMRIDATAEQREALTLRLGLDKPVPERYASWLGAAVRGDFGNSLLTDEPVSKRIADRLPATLLLAGVSLIASILLGIPLGVVSALRRNRLVDHAVGLFSVLGLSVPAFWLGIVMILVFSVELRLLPSSGIVTVGEDSFADRLAHLAMPSLVLATTILPSVVRFTRSSLLEVLGQDYVRTAVAKGLAPLVVTYVHALRNALIPVVSVIGTLLPRLLGGAVVTEAVFGWPGMGRLALEAANGRDYPLVMGITMVVALVAIVTSLVVDLAYTWLDPRLRLAA